MQRRVIGTRYPAALIRRSAAMVFLLAFVAVHGAAGQVSAEGAPPACSEPPAAVSSGTDMRTATLHATAELGYLAPDSARTYAAYVLDEMVRQFRYPTPFNFAVWGPMGASGDSAGLVIANEAAVVVRPNGQIRTIALTQSSLVPAIDAALIAAVRQAIESDAIMPPSILRVKNDITLYFALTFNPSLELTPLKDRPSNTPPLTRPRRTMQQPLLKLRIPGARFSSPLRPDRKASKPVRFPPDLIAAARDGDVAVEFVVGRDGVITPGTVRIIGATERGFASGVIRALAGLRFFPAEIDGCPVAVLAVQSFSFRIDR